METLPCPACAACTAASGDAAHALQAALRIDDLDRAIDIGLLDPAIVCPDCSDTCRAALKEAREARQRALAARERHRAREARLARRQHEHDQRRKAVAEAGSAKGNPDGLPPAAAAALARAKAKAAGQRDQ